MVEQAHIDQVERVIDAAGDQLICFARLRDAGWMIMGENDGGGISLQRLLDDFARVHRGVIYSASKQLIERQDAMTIVEEQAAKYLVWPVAQSRQQKILAVGWRADAFARRQLSLEISAAAFPGRDQHRGFTRSHAVEFLNRALWGVQYATNAAKLVQQGAREIDR